MDCYFRQYWNDERLGFKPLDLSAMDPSSSAINQLSLNVKMLEKIWKVRTVDMKNSLTNMEIIL